MLLCQSFSLAGIVLTLTGDFRDFFGIPTKIAAKFLAFGWDAVAGGMFAFRRCVHGFILSRSKLMPTACMHSKTGMNGGKNPVRFTHRKQIADDDRARRF